jgi:macrolide transport system ATP-binding/permease protein
MLLTLNHLSKSYGDRQVLHDVSLAVGDGQRIGLVGANGVGKSTLLKIIAGEVEADGGTITLAAGIRTGYLPQALVTPGGFAIQDLLDHALGELRTMETRLHDLEAHMATANGDLDRTMREYGDLLEQFERQGGYDIDHRITLVLEGLGVRHLAHDRLLTTLSGGEQSRLGLGALLLRAPDMLLLDEPTNHLDLAALTWLEAYLSTYPGGMLIVSHDRHFLNRAVNTIVEIDEHSHEAKQYTGDYDAYRHAKALERRRWEEDYARQQEEIRALRLESNTTARRVGYHRPIDGDKFLRFHKQTRVQQTVARRLNSAEERLRRIEANPVPEPPKPLRFDADFDPQDLKSQWPLAVSGLSKRYGEHWIFRDVGFTLEARSRMVITGPNGAGKSTLLRVLAGLEAPDGGDIAVSPQVRMGYLEQGHRITDPEPAVLDAYRTGLTGETQHHITDLLALGLFRYEDLRQRVADLSSGQQRKLQLARLIALRPNLLLLDEPTNFVSFDVLEAFEEALRTFPGPVVAASHDRRFIERFGGVIWELDNQRLVKVSEATTASS